MSAPFRIMLQMVIGKMLLAINLVILLFISKQAAMIIPSEHEKIGSVFQKLEVAEEIIHSAKEKLPNYIQSSLPLDCEDILKNGEKSSGIYLVWPINRVLSEPISVYCDMDTDGGGWTVIQRSANYSCPKDYFHRGWQDYTEGFGRLMTDFWLGNDNIYSLTNQNQYSLRFDLRDFYGNKGYALFDTFWIEEKSNDYTIHVSGHSGDAGDSFSANNGYKFSAKDRDNDKHSSANCADTYKGGWWYTNCGSAYFDRKYPKSSTMSGYTGLYWSQWKGSASYLATTEMKIRRKRSEYDERV